MTEPSASPKVRIHCSSHLVPSIPTPPKITIYPASALVTRTIPNILLKQGRNEIILNKLSPLVDEDSIKVRFIREGKAGNHSDANVEVEEVVISEIAVDLVRPPVGGLKFEINRKEDENGLNQIGRKIESMIEQEDDDDDNEIEISDNETPHLSSLSKQINSLGNNIKKSQESIESYKKQLSMLDKWGDTLSGSIPKGVKTSDVVSYLATYANTRMGTYDKIAEETEKLGQLEKELLKKSKEKGKLLTNLERKKKKEKEERQRKKEEERERKEEEGIVETQNRRKEPEKWYRVKVWIEREEMTVFSEGAKVKGKVQDGDADDDIWGILELSYIVFGASWTPRYDIIINSYAPSAPDVSAKPTAFLTYHAHFQNHTLETWKDAEIILSTSQTKFAGLSDKAPVLEPWKVSLAYYAASPHVKNRKNMHTMSGNVNAAAVIINNRSKGGLYSTQENRIMESEKEKKRAKEKELEGETVALSSRLEKEQKLPGMATRSSTFGAAKSTKMKESKALPMPRLNLTETSVLIPAQGEYFSYAGGGGGRQDNSDGETESSDEEDLVQGILDETESIAESFTPTLTPQSISNSAPTRPPEPAKPKFTSQGLTMTYLIPHSLTIPSAPYDVSLKKLKQLSASAYARKHTIETVKLPQVVLSYHAVPKLRAAAFLKAKVFNTSQTTFPKGQVGLTLDGTFLGTTTLPKTVYPDEVFTLNLGVDDSVGVNYAKPSIRRAIHKGGGWIGKSSLSWGKGTEELVITFGRSTILRNGRSDRGAIEVVVVDQVPTTEDARLQVNVVYPKGLKPPLLPSAAAPVNRRKGLEESGEVAADGDEEQHGISMKLGPGVHTGTGIYIEGFADDDPPASSHAPKTYSQSLSQSTSVPHVEAATKSPLISKKTGLRSSIAIFGSHGKSKAGGVSPSSSSMAVHVDSAPTPPASTNTEGKTTMPQIAVGEQKWGSATAAMRANGEVMWKVKLNPRMGVRLGLEYECRVPAGQVIAGL